jgi:predicted Mrr-cat superfamily restriction endonuclease
MKLFQLQTSLRGTEWMKEFLQDNYVCIGYSGIGDLEQATREMTARRLKQTYAYGEQELEEALEHLELFVHEMQDGDYVLISDGEWAYLGDAGDYFYNDVYDNAEDGRCHRRGVTWLKSLSLAALNPQVREFLTGSAPISEYTGALPPERLDLWLTDTGSGSSDDPRGTVRVDEPTIAEALAVLKEALLSEDPVRRERAAAAILYYAK